MKGPDFLWHPLDLSEIESAKNVSMDCDDSEIKGSYAIKEQEPNVVLSALRNISSWYKMIKVMALVIRFCRKDNPDGNMVLRSQVIKRQIRPYSVEELHNAELRIMQLLQQEYFKEMLQQGENKRFKGTLFYKLDPFKDENGILRVGGRLKHAQLPYELRHPVILPKESILVESIIMFYHQKVHHQGRSLTANELRQNGLWIIGGNRLISRVINQCVTCRKLRGTLCEQRMADLPTDRTAELPCFSFVGCDFFGPFEIKERRSSQKRYGCLFTCLVSRAVHIEVAVSLETMSFLNCLRRFQCSRGPVRQIRCDRGTNFVGASNELKAALREIDTGVIQAELLKDQCDWIEFKFNFPQSSHMGGVWERQIRTVRAILAGIMLDHGSILDNDSLSTVMCEVEAIVNSRPLTAEIHESHIESITPNHLLTLKTKVLLSPPGNFTSADLYSRRRWRRVQYLADLFWSRYRKEYLNTLMSRQKWSSQKANLSINDIVIVKEEGLPRNQWKLAKVIQVFPGEDDLVRKVKVQCGSRNISKAGKRSEKLIEYDRPIHKLVLLMKAD